MHRTKHDEKPRKEKNGHIHVILWLAEIQKKYMQAHMKIENRKLATQ